jgi:catechol 2,3-dioxygenase-like lactoylglutathione lyase family enzyme
MTDDGRPTFEVSYVIRFVDDMDAAVSFHRDVLGMAAGMVTPFWSEFVAEGVRLALHPATAKWPKGSIQLGFRCEDLTDVYERRDQLGIRFVVPPEMQHGTPIATFIDGAGNECRLAGRRR